MRRAGKIRNWAEKGAGGNVAENLAAKVKNAYPGRTDGEKNAGAAGNAADKSTDLPQVQPQRRRQNLTIRKV